MELYLYKLISNCENRAMEFYLIFYLTALINGHSQIISLKNNKMKQNKNLIWDSRNSLDNIKSWKKKGNK